LIANRGEIAMRIQRTAKSMGLETVAIFAPADRGALHVEQADLAIEVPSYLDGAAILSAARDMGAEAVHPGYGFLAENADFAQACVDAGLVFVGPSAQAIRNMGDKGAAKTAMAAAGVPCIPGYQGEDQSEARLCAEAEAIGYPVMIKAVAGGGGRGMRLVTAPGDFEQAMHSARSEALAAFGSQELLLERAITGARHVEVQIMADRSGTVIHLGERDCSVQRRHQKLIEEAPSPAVDADLRARMGAVCTAAAQAIGYKGAGTFEFLLGPDGAFWFMEMNTRLQVEHGVTELVAGVDLVALQLRVAMGAPLGLTQADVPLRGHAIEVRLCAEDPENGFLPQSGRVDDWQPPPDLRVDHALRGGAEVPPDFDSMIAKPMAHGADRAAALARLEQGLAVTRLVGLRTNLAFLSACLRHEIFTSGAANIDFVAQHGESLIVAMQAGEPRAAMICAGLMRHGAGSPLAARFGAPMRLERDGRGYAPVVTPDGHGGQIITMEGQASLHLKVLPGTGRAEIDGQRQAAGLGKSGAWVHWQGRDWDFADLTLSGASSTKAGASGQVRAAMPGRVGAVLIAVGDRVAAGQTLLTLEAMKMEHIHAAPVAGRIAAVHVAPGTQVAGRALLVEIVAGEDQAALAP